MHLAHFTNTPQQQPQLIKLISMITVCGEGLVDLVPIHSSTHTDPRLLPLTPALGGGPFNVAITAARQGEPTQFLFRVSTDNFGDALVDRPAKQARAWWARGSATWKKSVCV